MAWQEILIAIWMIFMACGLLAVFYHVVDIYKSIENLMLGQTIHYRLIMQIMQNVDPDAFAKIKAEIAAEAFRQGLVDLSTDEKE